jgi:hypothetical protein
LAAETPGNRGAMERKKRGRQASDESERINDEEEKKLDTQERLEVIAEVVNEM